MPFYPKIKLSKIRDIGWTLWDPIGLGSPGRGWPEDCADEYDRYLLEVSNMLCAGRSRRDASDYLLAMAHDHMGMSAVDSAATVATAGAIADYLQTLPDGPGKLT